jgi:phospholipid/cholesterol/gamma-HCH transport system substrate-binding protein
MSRELKVGLFFVGTLIILAVFIIFVGGASSIFKKPGYSLLVYVDTATGLDKGADVRMAGVKIGTVRDIRLARRKAEIILNISPRYQVPVESKAALSSVGLLGERYVEITPSQSPDFCKPGATLEASPSVSFDQLGSLVLSIGDQVKEVGQSLQKITGEKTRADLETTLANLRSFSGQLNEFMAQNKGELKSGIQSATRGARAFDEDISRITKNIDETVLLVKGVVEDNRENIKVDLEKIKDLLNRLEESLRLLNDSLEKINKGEGTLGKLIQDPKLYDEAKKTLASVQTTVDPLTQTRAWGSLRVDYLDRSEKVKSYINLGFSVSSRYFFLGQIAQDPRLDKFVYSAQGGYRLGPFVPRAGIIESEFGAGLDLMALSDRLIFSLDGYDFQRDDGAHLRFTSQVSFLKYFYLVAGVDDFSLAKRREFFFGLGFGNR